MAGQRWSEPGRDGARRDSRGRGLAGLALTLTLLGACGGDSFAPSSNLPATGPGPGVSNGAGDNASLFGAWLNVVVIQVPGDLQTWTTTWQFDAAGTCRQTVEIESLAEGFPRITERACTFVVTGGDVAISFVGGGTLIFAFSFAGFSPDRLVLDGFEYQRQT
jgi:hypothetical protein